MQKIARIFIFSADHRDLIIANSLYYNELARWRGDGIPGFVGD
jgi:hypothetical protein